MGLPRGMSLSSSYTKLGEVVGWNSGDPELTGLAGIWYPSTSLRLPWLVILSATCEHHALTRHILQDLITRWVKNVPLTN